MMPLTKPAFNILTLTCLPLLWYQAKQVRKHTLRLPPPIGECMEFCTHQSSDKFYLLVLGDSVAEGIGADHQKQALLGQLILALKQRHPHKSIHYQLIANTGDTSADIIKHLKNKQIETPLDLVVISAGVNDVTTLTRLKKWQKQINTLTHLLKTANAKQIVFLALPPMQHFPALPIPLNIWLGLRASMLNQILKKHIAQQEHVYLLKLALKFNHKYIAKDGFHPSALTYQAWAKAILTLLD